MSATATSALGLSSGSARRRRLGMSGNPVGTLTIAELLADGGGGSGQTRIIFDPTYLGANGGVTWVATDPLSGVDPGGKARYWCRYPANGGGFWRRNDWFALTVAEGAANAINLDWCTFDVGEDVTTVIEEIIVHYFNGLIQNTLSIKGPEITNIICDNVVPTGDGTASKFFWYKPLSTHCVVQRPPFIMGTENLMTKTWTQDAPGQWSCPMTETVAWLRIADLNNVESGNANPAWPGVKVPLAWTPNGSTATAAEANSPGLFHFTAGKLTVGAPSNPSTYFEGMDYFQEDPMLHENIFTFIDSHTLYVEGGGSRFGGPGLEFRGRIGLGPQQGRTSITYENIPPLVAILYSTSFVKAGSECTFLAGTGEAINCGLLRDRHPYPTGPDTVRRPEKMNFGGIHTSKLDINYAADWLHGDDGTLEGDALQLISMWGSAGNVGGQLLEAVNADNNGAVQWGNLWSYGHCRNINHVYKFTGRFEGNGLWPFFGGFGSDSFELGVSKADPCKFVFRASKLAGIAPADTDYCPNGRPYKIDTSGGWVPNAKFDSLQIQRLKPGYMEIELRGAVDRDGVTPLAIDLTDSLTNLIYNPALHDASVSGGGTVFEATNSFNTGFSNLYVKLKAQNGQGNIDCSVIDYRQPKFNYIGDIEFEGEGETIPCYAGLHNLGIRNHVHDFLFKNRPNDAFNFGEVSLWISTDGGGNINFAKKPQDNLIEDCTFESNQIIRVGKNTSLPPYNVDLNNVTFEGTDRTVIKIVPYGNQGTGGWIGTTRGHPIVIKANNVTNWGTLSAVVIDGALNGDDVYFSPDNGVTWYEPGWQKDGLSNVTKSAPPKIASLNNVWEVSGPANSVSNEMPAFVSNSEDVVTALFFDGDPGPFTETSGFTPISACDANTSSGDLYVRCFENRFATGTDAWDTEELNFSEVFTWTNSANLIGHAVNYRGAHATSSIGSNSASIVDNTGTASFIDAPTIDADDADSMMLYFFCTPGNVDVDAFSNGPGGHIMPLCFHDNVANPFGVQNANVGYAFAQVYAGGTTGRTGLRATFSGNTRAIATAIELKAA